MKTRNFLLLIASLAVIGCSGGKKENNGPWTELFNGKDFTGWTQLGGEAEYQVVDGSIKGTSVWGTPNSFMCTEKAYSDFILELEYKVSPKLNSGVQIRSNSNPDYRNGRVHGYQVEIDPSERAYSAGIYDEARRGWLYPLSLNESARSAFKQGEWNKLRVEAIGNHIKTWLNGIPVTNLYDEITSEGFIGLQVHSIHDSSKLGESVQWKNIKIMTENLDKYSKVSEAPVLSRLVNKLTNEEKQEGWSLLFDGNSFDGWRGAHKDSMPEKGWSVENGKIIVHASGGGESEHGGDVVTRDEYAAFDLMLEFKITEGANSGIKYFVSEEEDASGSAHGLEFQILDDKRHPDAEKYTTFPGSRTVGSLYDLIKAKNKRFAGVGQWNLARVVAYPDNRVEHWLNGMKVLEYERGSEDFRDLVAKSKYVAEKYNENGRFGEDEKGHILLQDHGDKVMFRTVKIKRLEK